MKKQQLFHAFFLLFLREWGYFRQAERSKGGFGRRRMLLGRAKSCRWQVFVRRRPPKQGELRTDVSKATMFQDDGAAKGFNFVSGKVLFGCADSRFVEPRISLRGRTNCHFLHAAKSNKNRSLCRELSRFCKPRFSSPQWRLR